MIAKAAASDRAPRAFVIATWLTMVIQCAWVWFRYSRNIPRTEDWILVPGLTGHDPHFWRSLWAQNNEHRVPFPQLVLQIVLRLAGGNFRVGMVFNVALIALTAAGLVRLARRVRGRTSYADAFFPIAFLHLGNWENLFWTWQATQIIPALLDVVFIAVLILTPALATIGSAAVAGISLVLLPLCGANGLFFVPFLGAWLCYAAWRQCRTGCRGRELVPATILLGATGLAGLLSALYFVGYERPAWVPTNPGVLTSLAAGLHFLSLAWGPAARASWTLSGLALIGLLGAAVVVTVRRLPRLEPAERHRALGLLWFTAAFLAFGLVVGWGRAGAVLIYGSWPLRYSLIALPVLVVSFFLWTLYAPPKTREWAPAVMTILLVLLLPLNTVHGFWFSQWYVEGTAQVLDDLRAGSDAASIAERNHKFLHHSRPPAELAERMVMLKAARMGPWVALPDDTSFVRPAIASGLAPAGPRAQEIRYRRFGAAKAILVWGVDGWRPLPIGQRPPGTTIRKGVMQTAMTKVDDRFIVELRAPPGHPFRYGFLVSGPDGREIWDGDYQANAEPKDGGQIIEVAGPPLGLPPVAPPADSAVLVPFTLRYPATIASAGFLVWGVNGWKPVPRAVRPGRTIIDKELMKTTLTREGNDLVARIDAPAGARLDYGLTLTDRRGLFDFVETMWDGPDDHPRIVADGTVRAKSALVLPDAMATMVGAWRFALAAGLGFLVLWGLAFVALDGRSSWSRG